MVTANDSIATLQEYLRAAGDEKTRIWWTNYVKGGAPFLGVKMATIRRLVHQWHDDHIAAAYDREQERELALALLRLPHSEEKLGGVLYLQEILIPMGAIRCPDHLQALGELFAAGHIYDWNVCDWFCVKVLSSLIGDEFEKDNVACARAIAAWHSAPNLWQARASAVAFVNHTHIVSFRPLLAQACATLIARPERFAKTAVGWVLREVSRQDPAFVRAFVEEHRQHFSSEALKNALKVVGPG